jgi:hypothetical protein
MDEATPIISENAVNAAAKSEDSALNALKISLLEQDKLTGLDISEVGMGWAYRQTAFEPARRLSWLTEQLLTLGVALIFCLPVTLLVSRAASGDDAQAVGRWIPVGGLGAIALSAAWTTHRWQAGKKLSILSHLLDEVDRFNETVAAVEILEELGSTQNSSINLENRQEVLEALHLTRESLVCGLMTERIMRKHQRFMSKRQEMFASIERNLATLQRLKISDEASDYGRLLNEAIQIGTSVHRELSQDNSRMS